MDIFDGLAINTGALGKPRYVPAERVREIVEGRVVLELSPSETERLPEYDRPSPESDILPETASRLERLVGWFRGGPGRR